MAVLTMLIQVIFSDFSANFNALSVPHTTRPMRAGEVHGKEYYFIDFGKFLTDQNLF